MTPFAETEITRAIRQQALAIEIALLIRKATAILSAAFSRADSLGMAATSAEGTARKPVCVNADANVRRSNSGDKIGRDSRRDGTADQQSIVAALFVQAGGCYEGLPGIEPWTESRDARLYQGPWPAVAHPPCQRWGKMWFGQPLTVKKTGVRKLKGDDGGCFASALASVRKWGGVIEHPWGSHAWAHFGLNLPPRSGGWVAADLLGGWTCCVEQGQYGHYARKPTLLYAFGVELPELRWGHTPAKLNPVVVARMGLKRAKRLGEVGARGGGTDSTPRIHTPIEFRDLLIQMARSKISGRRNAVQRAGFPAEFRVSLKHEERSSAIGPRAL